MPEREYFQQALANFTRDMAGGDAVRHLADLGCTVKQITKRQTFPMPYKKVQEIVWKHLLDTGTVLLEEPGSGSGRVTGSYIKEYDAYGRPSFRFSPSTDSIPEGRILFREAEFSFTGQEKKQKSKTDKRMPKLPEMQNLNAYLAEQCEKNGEEASYISCDFGMYEMGVRDIPAGFSLLDRIEQDYILGLPWEKHICYHRLNCRMRKIAAGLYAGGQWQAICYFLKTKEKIRILQKEL